MSTRFTILIPARMASTRLPGKPLLDLAGTPMIVRVAQAAQRAEPDRLAVATDSTAIAAAVQAHGFEAVLTREDHLSGTDRLAEAADKLGLARDEIVVNLQGDEPFMPPSILRRVGELLDANPNCAMSTAGHEIHDQATFLSPNVVKVVCRQDGRALYFSRAPIPMPRDPADSAQSTPIAMRHIGLYAYRASFLSEFPKMSAAQIEQLESLEQLRALWHGHDIVVAKLDQDPGAGIDTPEDLANARERLRTSDPGNAGAG